MKPVTVIIFPVTLSVYEAEKAAMFGFFFDSAYPAYKSRKIILHVLEIAGIISAFDKNSNYDRLFPNEDYHSGKGLGNLIALPFQAEALKNKNSCFIDPVNEIPFEDQFNLLKSIRVSVVHLDNILDKIDNPYQMCQ